MTMSRATNPRVWPKMEPDALVIPQGKAAWRYFVAHATPEQRAAVLEALQALEREKNRAESEGLV